MKRLIELTICSLLTVNSMAQQALWNGDSIVSPTINENRSVTFRLYAPNANKVEVEGDFLLPKAISTPVGSTESPGKVVMKKNKTEYGNIPPHHSVQNYIAIPSLPTVCE